MGGKGLQMYAREASAPAWLPSGRATIRAKRYGTRWRARKSSATTGTRLIVRVFGGFDFSQRDLDRSDFAAHGYANGVPMGGDLKTATAGKAPALLIRAIRDPDGANLDRIQVIKGWLDAPARPQEKVYDVAWSGNRKPDANGKLPAVGNTVNVAEATYTIRSARLTLQAFWKDPTSIRSNAPSTMSASWRSRRRDGRRTTPSSST